MPFEDVLEEYRRLVGQADRFFARVLTESPGCVACRLGCSDCCNAIFGLFLVEALHLQQRFLELGEETRLAVIQRADIADRKLREIHARLAAAGARSELSSEALSKQRMPCPLLGPQKECVLHAHRPITCRVYGVPTAIHGRLHVCEKAHFRIGETYPSFDLDAAYGVLFRLSRRLLEEAGETDLERASYLVSVSKAISTPSEELLTRETRGTHTSP